MVRCGNLNDSLTPVNYFLKFVFINDLEGLFSLRRSGNLDEAAPSVNRFLTGQSNEILRNAVAFNRCSPEKEVLCKSRSPVNRFLYYCRYLSQGGFMDGSTIGFHRDIKLINVLI